MKNSALFVYDSLCRELADYLKSQYFSKSPLLLNTIDKRLLEDGLLSKKPYIESTPAYLTVEDGIQKSTKLDSWLKEFFSELVSRNIGIHKSPYKHQIQALEGFLEKRDLFIATGTGSGKTECFMWPILAKVAKEAKENQAVWQNQRGIRTLILYPMNALVSDQLSRLRRMLGDDNDSYLTALKHICDADIRRPQFGMYTGRTPYPGQESDKKQDKKLADSLSSYLVNSDSGQSSFLENLKKQGKIPAKRDLASFIENLRNGNHITSESDTEMISRFEMMMSCPDILITNYSMLELMLIRPREEKIWSETRKWLNEDSENRLLLVIDEAHMYRGSFGGEVALLLRRLMAKLGVSRDKIQFILTTASMPSDEGGKSKAMDFADNLTGATKHHNFVYLTGETQKNTVTSQKDIPFEKFMDFSDGDFEPGSDEGLKNISHFFELESHTLSYEFITQWLYDNLVSYKQFSILFEECRGQAKSIDELAESIFGNVNANSEDKAKAVSVLLAIAPLAKNKEGLTLFPARMHMLFRGIHGVYACTNPSCPKSTKGGGISLGQIFLTDDGKQFCPECHSMVYELFNDRRCGALFFKGYVGSDFEKNKEQVYLWNQSNNYSNADLREIHLYIPEDGFTLNTSDKKIKKCILDTRTGFINFMDHSWKGENYLTLYYNADRSEGKEKEITFGSCPHCRHTLGHTQLTSFKTVGNLGFNSLINASFKLQPPVKGKDSNKYPNEGRKILVFSDSRARAAKLALEMSNASDNTISRQLFALAVKEQQKEDVPEQYRDLNHLYGFLCQAVADKKTRIFNGDSRDKLLKDSEEFKDRLTKINQKKSWHKKKEYPDRTLDNAPDGMQEYLLRFFAGNYNTFFDNTTMVLEPTESARTKYFDALHDEIGDKYDLNNESVQAFFINIFYAWIRSIFDKHAALGQTISDKKRHAIRRFYNIADIGLSENWKFSEAISQILDLKNNEKLEHALHKALRVFLDNGRENIDHLYVDMQRVYASLGRSRNYNWYRCDKCSEITHFKLNERCSNCGSDCIHELTDIEKSALAFWTKPIDDVLDDKDNSYRLFAIDTEEHTAQLSYKDQRDELWSKTEEYELRFQDIVEEGESPVDILSSTTTMEVGIDIGSLVCVALRNIPPTRENYQQRAGRAGRRGASLSTILTYCEDGPHDSLYYKNPVAMFRGDPRAPWIDVQSEKLIERHLSMIVVQSYLVLHGSSLDDKPANEFFEKDYNSFADFIKKFTFDDKFSIVPDWYTLDFADFTNKILCVLKSLKEKTENHPELYSVSDFNSKDKSLLDALYEEGLIPTYSFPKNVVSAYITNSEQKTKYRLERGLDVAISEYAPGRAVVVDKKIYQIGAIYSPPSNYSRKYYSADNYFKDPHYFKNIVRCNSCGWFDIHDNNQSKCPFCGNTELDYEINMLRPWGFAPKDSKDVYESELEEKYSSVLPPIYSTVPPADEMIIMDGCKHIRKATRKNQRVIMLNKGHKSAGFKICTCCGATMPGNEADKKMKNYALSYYGLKTCKHEGKIKKVDLGFDFITDMLVLEICLPTNVIDFNKNELDWINRASQSASEALRLAASYILDIDFSELVTGFRIRNNKNNAYVDLYLYDQLSSGAGYSSNLDDNSEELLSRTLEILNCNCSCACYQCIKHYKNSFVHSKLDRLAAIDLLKWGRDGVLPLPLTKNQQLEILLQFKGILSSMSIDLLYENDEILVKKQEKQVKVFIYPTIVKQKESLGCVHISEFVAKYRKAKVLELISESLQ